MTKKAEQRQKLLEEMAEFATSVHIPANLPNQPYQLSARLSQWLINRKDDPYIGPAAVLFLDYLQSEMERRDISVDNAMSLIRDLGREDVTQLSEIHNRAIQVIERGAQLARNEEDRYRVFNAASMVMSCRYHDAFAEDEDQSVRTFVDGNFVFRMERGFRRSHTFIARLDDEGKIRMAVGNESVAERNVRAALVGDINADTRTTGTEALLASTKQLRTIRRSDFASLPRPA